MVSSRQRATTAALSLAAASFAVTNPVGAFYSPQSFSPRVDWTAQSRARLSHGATGRAHRCYVRERSGFSTGHGSDRAAGLLIARRGWGAAERTRLAMVPDDGSTSVSLWTHRSRVSLGVVTLCALLFVARHVCA